MSGSKLDITFSKSSERPSEAYLKVRVIPHPDETVRTNDPNQATFGDVNETAYEEVKPGDKVAEGFTSNAFEELKQLHFSEVAVRADDGSGRSMPASVLDFLGTILTASSEVHDTDITFTVADLEQAAITGEML